MLPNPEMLNEFDSRDQREKMMRTKKRLAATSLAFLLASLPVFNAAAQDRFPSKPVRMIVPFSAGSQTDAVARAANANVRASQWRS